MKSIHTRISVRGLPSVSVGGLAGTGKTTLIAHIHEAFGIGPERVAYCAFTGKAATVINRRFPKAGATTIHKLIYRAMEYHCEKCPARKGGICHYGECDDCTVKYVARTRPAGDPKLIVVDEASMVPEILYNRLMSYNVPIVWVGDHGQLPPVMSAFNVVEKPDLMLQTIHRQAENSPIIQMAHYVRNADRVPRVGDYDGVVSVKRTSRLPGFDLEEWDRSELAILVPTNRMRVAVNKAVRRELGRDPDVPVRGDRLICLRNNDEQAIFNGLCGTVDELGPAWLGQEYYSMVVDVEYEDRTYAGKAWAEQFNNRENLADRVRRQEADLWDYGYGLTVHKAQGSEYDRVVLVVDLAKVPTYKKRWLYTAITRAKKKLEIIYPD